MPERMPRYRRRWLMRKRERIAQADALLMQLESPLESVLAAAKIAHQHHTTVALNPAPARELPDELLALVDIITPNENGS
ncbi:ribokinase [Salmonella enterica subsp. enterica]|uniref:Ribokinase n=1 Tax=Salmonella enterica I TaxID=59201 RepID=A0A3S5DM91_SALET|nr:ribokinase [Salmonella enterica subsp. enterica]